LQQRSGDDRDPEAVPVEQMLHRHLTARDVVHPGGAGSGVLAPVEYHHGQAAILHFRDTFGIQADRCDDHAGDALLLEKIEATAFFGRGAVTGAPQRVEPIGVHRRLGATGEVGEVRVGEVLEDDSERAAAALTELPGALVAYETELADGRAYALAGSFGHEVWPV
jgi:hypothetical protein